MIENDTFNFILSDLIDELPQVFFRELSGGIITSDDAPLSEYAQADDLYVFGQYVVNGLGRQVIIYKGSFDKFYSGLSEESLKDKLREVLRHEFRHHIEFLSGIHNSESLEAEDAREIREYLERAARMSEENSLNSNPFEK